VPCFLESTISAGQWRRCRSLCIIDEFGKGTLTSDGVGLLASALRQLATAAEPPKVVAVTHFSELLNADYLPRLAAFRAECIQ
jgi:DNA mismatch repair ATPase MutS